MKNLITISLAVISFFGFSQSQETTDLEVYKVYQQKGREFLLQGNYEKAISMLDSGLVKMPYSHSMYYERGYAYMQLKKYDNAITNFSHIIDRADYKYAAYLNRGICYFEKSQFENSKSDFERTLELDPDNKTAQNFLGEVNHIIQNTSKQTHNEEVSYRQRQLEQQIIDNRRHQEAIFWGTVIPLVFWTTIFLTW